MSTRCRVICPLALLLGLAIPSPTPAAGTVALHRLAGGLLAAPVTLGGEELWMVVDTGATRSMVRADVAARLGLRARARFVLETTAGTVDGLCAGPLALWVGGQEMSVDCLGWSAAANLTVLAPGADGILAADALATRPVLLDAAAGVLVVDPEPGAVAGETVPLSLEAGRPALTLPVGRNTGRLRLVLDSGADQLVLFGATAAAVPARRRVGLDTLSGSRAAAVGTAPRLGRLRRPPREALLLPDLGDRGEDGLLPLASVGRVLLDWPRGVAVIAAQRPSPDARAPGGLDCGRTPLTTQGRLQWASDRRSSWAQRCSFRP